MADNRPTFVGPIRRGIQRFTSRPHLGPLSIPRPISIKQDQSIQSPPDFSIIGVAEGTGGALSPNLQPSIPTPDGLVVRSTPDGLAVRSSNTPEILPIPCRVDEYILLELMDSTPKFQIYKAVNIDTQQQCICKVIPLDTYKTLLAPYLVARTFEGVGGPQSIVVGATFTYAFFPLPHSDLHTFIRAAGRLSEPEARLLFGQIVTTVKQCHNVGLILRDIKLRKCIFTDSLRCRVQLTGLEEAYLLADLSNDRLMDKHGCPAYVSPEIINSFPPSGGGSEPEDGRSVVGEVPKGYSGRAADVWSLGVVLYIMLFGRYPFQETDPVTLFARITRGRYALPDTLSPRARCLIRSLLRHEPADRLTPDEILAHPWFRMDDDATSLSQEAGGKTTDRNVPEVAESGTDGWFNSL